MGSAYSGWQVQPGRNTVAEKLLRALHRLTNEELKLHVAGRTDAGVHAIAQVVHFDTNKYRDWICANNFLPGDIRIMHVSEVPSHFHARYRASNREYVYVMELSKVANPLNYLRVLHVSQALDIDNMKAAAMHLVGTADFSSWRCSGCASNSAIRTIEHINIECKDQYLVTTIKANSFLYHMVRNIMGTLYLSGRGALSPSQVLHMKEGKDTLVKIVGLVLPAHGLYFRGVSYYEFPDITAMCYNITNYFCTS
jgi:tRNA pseudouridine38-40 synthase